MRWRVLAATLAALLLMGNIQVAHTSSGLFDPLPVEVPFGRLEPGASVGANATNASASLAGTLVATTADVLYLNNTNATAPVYARLEVVATTGLGALTSLVVGIDNGTRAPQISGGLGTLTQSTGALVRLAPGSTNRLYVTQAVAAPGSTGTVTFRVIVADDPAEKAYVATRGRVTIL